jgi:hypothetical protein
MSLNSTVTSIQSSVKRQLGLTSTPLEASSPNIKAIAKRKGYDLDSLSFTEKSTLVGIIVNDYQKNNTKLSVANMNDSTKTEITIDSFVTNEPATLTPESNDSQDSTALTFTNNFEKAAMVKTELAKTGMILSDIQSLKVSESMENSYNSLGEFLIAAYNKLENQGNERAQNLRLAIQQKQQKIMDDAMNANADLATDTAKFLREYKDYQTSFVDSFIEGFTL